jgi:Zn-dependent protease with chaperone function
LVAYAGQAILHTTIAALVLEALLRLWRVQDPGERLRLRWVVLLSPLLTAAYLVLAPARSTDGFGVRWALFAGDRWNALHVGPLGAATAVTWLLAVLGVALYLRDAIPFLADRTGRQAPDEVLPEGHPAVQRLREHLGQADAPAAPHPVDVRVVALDTPVLLCSGVDRPCVIASTAALDLLTDTELRAALAHELEHVAHRDPLCGWWLMAVRTLQCFNPAIQVVGRQAVVEIERRADLGAVNRGFGVPLAAAIARLGSASGSLSDLVDGERPASLPDRVQARAHRHALGDRCERLIEACVPVRSGLSPWHMGLAGAILSVVLFFVV